MLEQVEQYLTDNADRFVEELFDLLRIPSISGDSQYADDVHRAAAGVRNRMAEAGLQTEVIATAGFPIVYGEWLGAPGAPTVVVYGHYDVQPPDPLEDWITPPFEPTIRDGHVYARGATDDKGQCYTHVKSVEAWLKTHGRLPVNVKFIIEGEEEVGSENLNGFLKTNREKCRADVAVISDTSQYAPGMPAITYGLRGILACEVTVCGPSQDLHSGMFGGSLANPVNALATMIAALIDESGRIQIPGFYDDVLPLSAQERQQLANLPFDEASYLKERGVEAVWGEEGFTTLERRWARPTCDVNGFIGGYTGEGPKTIVPARATAKISCRLVPDQDPAKLTAALEAFLGEHCRGGLRMEFTSQHGGAPLVFDTRSPYMTAAKAAIQRAFGNEPVFIREGGSIPVVASFRDLLGVDTLLLGWGQDTDNLHSPNERFKLEDFHRGTRASAVLWQELAG
ncbi:MAG: dipeptidase [Planctomycetaceae bacterium]